MATKNKDLIYDIDILQEEFDAFCKSLGLTDKEKDEIKSLLDEIKSLKNEISITTTAIDDLSKKISPDYDKRTISSIKEEIDAYYSLARYSSDLRFVETASKKEKLTSEEQARLDSLDTVKILSQKKKYEDIANMFLAKYNSSNETKKVIKELEQHLKDRNLLNELLKKKQSQDENLSNLEGTLESLRNKESDATLSLDNFNNFLNDNGLSTTHAQEIFDYIYNRENALQVESGSFKIRKRHPMRDRIIKRGGIPTAITAAGIGATVLPLASQSLIAGSTAYGLLPVFGSMAMTTFATATIGAAAGLALTPAIIASKNALTKSHYKLWYKSAKSNLSEYENGTDLENLPISKLMERVENTKHRILKLNEGNWFTKTLKFLPKHFLNTINRNRIHHIEKYTKDLMAMYAEIENGSLDAPEKAKKLKPIFELLKQVEGFVDKDVAESKVYAMLTCKESGKHIHKTIENIDIFANLKIYLDTVGLISDKKEKVAQEKQAKKTTKNIKQKTAVATRILNGERLITKMLSYDEKYAKYGSLSSTEHTVTTITPIDSDAKVILSLDNGKSIILDKFEIKDDTDIATVKIGKTKTTITYIDGSTTQILKAKKLIPEVETARRVMFEKLSNDSEFINTLKTTHGIDTRTINSLKEKLRVWLEDTSSKLVVSGNAKTLYNIALDEINANTPFTSEI